VGWKEKLLQKRRLVLCSKEQSTQEDGSIIGPTISNKSWHGLVLLEASVLLVLLTIIA